MIIIQAVIVLIIAIFVCSCSYRTLDRASMNFHLDDTTNPEDIYTVIDTLGEKLKFRKDDSLDDESRSHNLTDERITKHAITYSRWDFELLSKVVFE